MLFYLTNSLIVSPNVPDYVNICNAVRNLANAAYESKHILLGDYDVLQHYAKIFRPVGDGIALLLNHLVQNYATMSVPSEITFYVEVVNGGVCNKRTENNIVIQQLYYTEFLDSSTTQKMKLVGEDLNDCKMFIHILNWYKNKHQLHLNCAYEIAHGAGNRTSDNLSNFKREKRIALCIVDTDIRYPGQPVKSQSTHLKCKRIANVPMIKTIVLDVHEIENIIPIDYINRLGFDAGEVIKKTCYDKLHSHADAENILPYFDHKKGVVKMQESMNDPNFITFAKQCFDIYSEWNGANDFQSYYDSLVVATGVVYPGLGENLLKRILDLGLENLPAPTNFKIFQLNEWNKIGLAVLNFGCARSLEAIS